MLFLHNLVYGLVEGIGIGFGMWLLNRFAPKGQ